MAFNNPLSADSTLAPVRDAQSLRFGESHLIRIKGEQLPSAHHKGGGDMQDVKGTVPTDQGVGGGEAFRLLHDVGKIARLDSDSSRHFVGIELGKKARGITRRDGFPEFRETQRVAQLELMQDC